MFYNLGARDLFSLDACYCIHTSGETSLVHVIQSGYFLNEGLLN